MNGRTRDRDINLSTSQPTRTKWYNYRSLSGEEDIRVLLVKSARDTSLPLIGSLEHASLRRDEKYSALSYSWATDNGDSSTSETITIDGQAVSITTNLFHGLRRIRRPEDVLRIWIDAICINQRDSAERSHQVARMAEIYQNADRVIVWLGEGNDAEADDRIEGILNRLAGCSTGDLGEAHLRAILHDSTKGWCEGETHGQYDKCTVLPTESLVMDDPEHPLLDTIRSSAVWRLHHETSALALKAFFSKRYWTRRWIAQEFIFSRSQDWYWGGCSIRDIILDWHHLEALSDAILIFRNLEDQWHSGVVDLQHTLFTARLLRDLLRRQQSNRPIETQKDSIDPKLVQALGEMNQMNCQDPRDRLYALLGLCDHPPLPPDYSLSAAEVFISFAATMVQARKEYLLFQQFAYQEGYENPREDGLVRSLPSWAPDLRTNFVTRFQECAANFQATISEDRRILKCHVYLLGAFSAHITEEEQQGLKVILQKGLPFRSDPLERQSTTYSGSRMAYGDIICSSDRFWHSPKDSGDQSELPPGAMLLMLRPVSGSHQTYQIVRTLAILSDELRELFEMRIEVSTAQDMPMVVNIV